MAEVTPDVLTLAVPDDPRYLGVAVATAEALAVRAGIDKEQLAGLVGQLEVAVGERFGQGRSGGRLTLRYEVGDGFLGLRLLNGAGTTRGVTS
jgi:hypothetical protein